MILGLEYHRSPARYFAGRAATSTRAGGRAAGVIAANFSPLRLVNRREPRLPGPQWTRVRPLLSGICGSELGLLTGRNSPYLSAVISMPFTPGHEVVGETLDDLPSLPRGSRVVVDPVLGCLPRAVAPCEHCAGSVRPGEAGGARDASAAPDASAARDAGAHSRCNHVTAGAVAPGIQTGYCADTGGGWSRMLVAHESQLHRVPSTLDTTRAVLVEPLACAIHTVRRIAVPDGAAVIVVGAGTVGLLTILALRECTKVGPIYAIAKHAHQRERARELGATEIFTTDRAARALRRATGGFLARPDFGDEYLLGGAEIAFECTGGSGLSTALRLVRAGGTVVLSGMPNAGTDLTPVWFRELQLVGAYASGGRDFPDALALAQDAPLSGYVDAVYPLSRWREAIGHANAAGRLGTVKVAFDPTKE
ncbi:MAG: zinc-binding dehydrogenase [Micromonosporaceae bacterium]|nr:zinc-binding dehydrogenase [Micromonosporaceae bacterium]